MSTPSWLAAMPRPWVVVDWGMLRALPAGEALPGTFTAVIPDTVVREILTSSKPSEFFAKFKAIVCHKDSTDRMLVGHYWQEVSQKERNPRRPVAPVQAISLEVSELLRSVQEERIDFEDPSTLEGKLTDRKALFVELANRFTRTALKVDPDMVKRIRGSKANRVKELRDAPVKEIVMSHGKPFDTRAGHKALDVFPDRLAVARWTRLVVWYSIVRASSPDQPEGRFGNNYEDADYAFLSSYTRHIVTRDRGLKEAVAAAFDGSVRIYASFGDIPSAP